MESHDIIVTAQGTLRHLYSDDLAAITASVGRQRIQRASHVEPFNELDAAATAWIRQNCSQLPSHGGWWANLQAVDGPILGPFETRASALQAEIDWLRIRAFPTPRTDNEGKHDDSNNE